MPNLARTTVVLPPITLRSRCGICQLFHTHPALFDALNEKLLGGVAYKHIISWLHKAGIRVVQSSLWRHREKHLLPFFRDALEIERHAAAFSAATAGQDNITIAGVLLRVLAAKVVEALPNLSLTKLKEIEALKLIHATIELAQTIAYADRTAADSALKAEELELKKLRLAKSKEELAAVAVDWLRKELAGRPDLVEHLRDQLALPSAIESAPEAAAAAIPAPKPKPRAKGTPRA